MRRDGEADIADLTRHGVADPLPDLSRTIEAIDAAVVLLPDAVGPGGGKSDEVRVLAILRVGIGHEVRLDALVQRRPARRSVEALEHAAGGGGEVHVSRSRADR